jgi:hypothetical protein
MKRTRLVRTTKTSEVSLLGSSDQRKLASIRRITKSDPFLAKVFAEPVLDANEETISWYTDLSGSISPYEELSSSDKRFLDTSWKSAREKLHGLRDSLNAADRVILDNVVETPGVMALHLVGHELLVTDWSSVRVGYRPKNRNIGIDLDPETFVEDIESDEKHIKDLYDPSSSDEVLKVAKVDANTHQDIPPKSTDEQQQAPLDYEEMGPLSKSQTSFLYSLWFWGSLFVLLCCLNWFLLIDACGVEGIQFLNFCLE